jgi:hypothetical protein
MDKFDFASISDLLASEVRLKEKTENFKNSQSIQEQSQLKKIKR